MTTAYWVTGDARQVMAELPANSIDLLITSPPFWNLRSYLPSEHTDKATEMGSEATPGEFIDGLLDITEAAARLLTPHGTLCVELGDTMSGSTASGGDYQLRDVPDGERRTRRESFVANGVEPNTARRQGIGWPLAKSHCLIPELYRFALAYGFNPLTGRTTEQWRIRNVVRWVRSNPPVGALGDKFRPATSDLVIACKAKNRWFDLDAVRTVPITDLPPAKGNNVKGSDDNSFRFAERINSNPAGAPPLDWWLINPTGFRGSHYAVFPPELCVKPIEAMCPRRVCRTCGQPSRRLTTTDGYVGATGEDRTSDAKSWASSGPNGNRGKNNGRTDGGITANVTTTGWTTCGCPGADGLRLDGWHTGTGWRPGRVLDPFAGTGTVGAVATGHGRDAILSDLDERNLALAQERVGMFLVETTASDLAALLGPEAVPRT